MTILSHLFPESHWSPYSAYYSWLPVDPFNFNRSWRDEAMVAYLYGLYGESIPIDEDEEESSDSDGDLDNNVNQNSLPMQRKRKLVTVQNPLSGTSKDNSNDLPSPAKQKAGDSKNQSNAGVANDSQKHFGRLHTKPTAIFGKAEDVLLIDDDECEINQNTNYEAYTLLKTLLESTGRCIDEMKGDGNCFFRALSKVIYGKQKFYNDIRQAVVDLIAKYPKKFEAVTDGPVSSHIQDMRMDKTWATQTEIYAAATLLGRSIYILSPDQKGDNYKWLLFSPLFPFNKESLDDPCYITICHTHGNHYDRIAPLKAKCNCVLEPPELSGVKGSVDLTEEEYEIV